MLDDDYYDLEWPELCEALEKHRPKLFEACRNHGVSSDDIRFVFQLAHSFMEYFDESHISGGVYQTEIHGTHAIFLAHGAAMLGFYFLDRLKLEQPELFSP